VLPFEGRADEVALQSMILFKQSFMRANEDKVDVVWPSSTYTFCGEEAIFVQNIVDLDENCINN